MASARKETKPRNRWHSDLQLRLATLNVANEHENKLGALELLRLLKNKYAPFIQQKKPSIQWSKIRKLFAKWADEDEQLRFRALHESDYPGDVRMYFHLLNEYTQRQQKSQRKFYVKSHTNKKRKRTCAVASSSTTEVAVAVSGASGGAAKKTADTAGDIPDVTCALASSYTTEVSVAVADTEETADDNLSDDNRSIISVDDSMPFAWEKNDHYDAHLPTEQKMKEYARDAAAENLTVDKLSSFCIDTEEVLCRIRDRHSQFEKGTGCNWTDKECDFMEKFAKDLYSKSMRPGYRKAKRYIDLVGATNVDCIADNLQNYQASAEVLQAARDFKIDIRPAIKKIKAAFVKWEKYQTLTLKHYREAFGRNHKVTVEKSNVHGLGVFAKQDITKVHDSDDPETWKLEDVLCLYTGDYYSSSQEGEYCVCTPDTGDNIFCIKSGVRHVLECLEHKKITLGRGRFINHAHPKSKKCNVAFVLPQYERKDGHAAYINVIPIKNIKAGEELFVDYGEEYFTNTTNNTINPLYYYGYYYGL